MARRAGPKHSTGVEETYARGRMGVLAALATLALVGTGAAGAFAATTIPQSDATSEDVTPAVAMVVDDADTPAVITGDTADQDPTEDATPVPPEDPAPAPAPAPTPEVTTPTDTTAPTPTEASKPSGEGEVATTTDQLETDIPAEDADAQSDGDGAMLLAVGPDGGEPPYVYWDVRDTNGNLVPGATFKFDARVQSSSWPYSWTWNNGSNANGITDCVGTCSTDSSGNVLDRDGDGGEYLLEHRSTPRTGSNSGTNRIAAGSNYRVSQVTAPPGYEWVVSGSNTKTIGNTNSNTATWNNGNGNQTHNFGTFRVEKVDYSLSCAPGVVYGISGGGQLQEITSGNVKNLGGTVSGQSNMNGLGIGPDGEPVYAIARSGGLGTNLSATVYQYNTLNGTWTSVSNSSGNTSSNLVGGAVNLKTGIYYFGGFTSNGNFRVYQFNPNAAMANRITFKGTVVTGLNSSSNGDMAFDDEGNLYIVHGSGTTSTVYSVTAANFEAANGTNMASSQTRSFTTMSDVNGITFDSDGKIYLGSSGTVRSYNMPGFTDQQTVVSSGLSSTDLAGCGSPPTIVIEKEVVGGRAKTGDQFRMTLNQGNTELGTATTTGNSIGVQAERIGPVPTVRNVALTFAEFGANDANLNDYASAYQCTVTHRNGTVENLQQVNGTSGSITIPPTGDAVRCVFRNSPLVANVTINKQITDALGQDPRPAEGWTVGASIAATTGTATQIPATTNQTTNSDGNAIWNVKFEASNHRATVNVSEVVESEPGYAFLRGQCVVTSLNGDTATTTLEGPGATDLRDIKPGDRVACTYVNKPAPGTLAIEKAFDDSLPEGFETEVEFTGEYTCTLADNTVASGTWSRKGEGEATLKPDGGMPAANQIPAGAVCSATEDQPTGNDGLPNESWAWGDYEVSSDVTIASGETGKLTVTNKAKRVYGNFSVTKVVPAGSVVTSGMTFGGDWTCILDEEIVEGKWGPIAEDETWTSTSANQIPLGATCTVVGENREDYPAAGYVWDGDPIIGDPVTAKAQDPDVITVTNKTKAIVGPTLPLTGGQSAAMFTILGGGLLAGALALTAIRRRKGGARRA